MKLSINSQTQSSHRKVRLKCYSTNIVIILITILSCAVNIVNCNERNNPPRFIIDDHHSEIVLRLKEGPETPVGSLIYTLKGYDPDGDALEFGVQSTYDSDIISVKSINDHEAGIYLEKELDRETKDAYTIILTLTDNKLGEGRYVTQSLLLLVEDVNDSEPIFTSFPSAIEVPENSQPGILLTVEATDRDEGAYGQVVYYLEELDGENDAFSISTSQGKGVIRLRKPLDYERKSLYQLKVLAIDRANQGRINTGTAAIVVKVTDLEDNGPQFISPSPVTRISESVPKGSYVTTIKAVDGDRGVNNKIKYSIVRGGNNMFKIDEDTGVITTLKQLDREDSRNLINGAYILEILAVERSKVKPAPSVKTEITIILIDENDSTPQFKSNRYECEIPENAQQNTPVNFLQIEPKNEVFDYDLGNNGTFELYLDPPNDIFDISPKRSLNEATFIIRVRNPKLLDYERLKVLNFTIVAKEITQEGKSSSVPLTVYIKDRNDNIPQFSKQSYNIAIPENVAVGVSIAKIEAYDLDSENFGTKGIRYTGITGSISQLLNMNASSGVITIKSTAGHFFDREQYEKHHLTIEARDNLGEGNRNTVPLIITIVDINDEIPTFLQRKYETRLFENRRTFETPLELEARDADVNGTRNSEIFYEIVAGDFRHNFTIDIKSGIMRLKSPIDFEKLNAPRNQKSLSVRPITLTVQASDGGSPSQASQVPVVIYVQDENDFAPIFEKTSYAAEIMENLEGGTSILSVKAVDLDGSSPNNLVYYRIVDGAFDKFVIGSDSGIISIANGASLDPDLSATKRQNYLLNISALDGGIGDEQLSSFCTVSITIIDVNNKPPTFADLETVFIKENTAVGTSVYRLIANDLDSDATLRYFFDSESSEARNENGVIIKQSEYDYMQAFDLNANDGLIRVVKILDREKIETIKIGVVVEDIAAINGKQTASAILNVVILDENDNNPKFQKPFYRKSIMENSQIGTHILHVVAIDVDKNNSVTYELDGPDEILNFLYLDAESGEILVQEKIDHELYEWLNFTVRARDSGTPQRSSLAEIHIQILDENDNAPYFITDFQNLSIYENQPVGSMIAVIEANDLDSGDYGKITFMIDRLSAEKKFAIDPDTGVLTVADKIDREEKSSYMIVIEIFDNYQFGVSSGESRNAFKQFYIKILDENDHAPVVEFPSQKEPSCTSITEFHDIKEVVTSIRVSDADDPTSPNGQVRFEIRGGSGADMFVLKQTDPWNANIFARNRLNKKYGNYTLDILVKDLGTPQMSVDMKLDICVQDFNDHAPYFVSPINNYTIRVSENATVGQAIAQVVAKDEDIGLNALVNYRFKPDLFGNYKSFAIDANTGLITLRVPLDREKQKIYEIRVEAYDHGIPKELSSDLDLIIYVHSIDSFEPSFLVQSISVNFTEHVEPGIEKRKLPDTVDRDEVDDLDDDQTVVCYYIVHGNEDDLFQLDRVTHILTVSRELDREKRQNYSLIIKATEDCLNPPMPLNETAVRIPKAAKLINRKAKSEINRFTESLVLNNSGGVVGEFETIEDDSMVATDATLVRVLVMVQDINDNPPKFVNKIFTGGVSTSADFGTEIMTLKAHDPDIGPNAKLSYFQVGKIHRTLAEGLGSVKEPSFLIDKNSGSIKLNFDPQKDMKGYFDFTVVVKDLDGLNDTAHVFIYLLREDQRVRFVLRQQNFEIREKIDKFRDAFSNVTKSIVNVDYFKVHENKDGTVDRTKTDLYLHLVNKNDNSVIDVSEVLRLVDQNIEQLDELFKEFNVIDTQASEALVLQAELGNHTQAIIWLVMVNLIMGALLIIVITLCLSQRKNYRRELKAARVNAYVPTDTGGKIAIAARVPNTNKHSTEGSNPIWLQAYENEWYKNDDSYSQGSSSHDSLDENVLVSEFENTVTTSKEFNGLHTQNNLIKHLNMYQHIDKLTNGTIIAKKLETTEL